MGAVAVIGSATIDRVVQGSGVLQSMWARARRRPVLSTTSMAMHGVRSCLLVLPRLPRLNSGRCSLVRSTCIWDRYTRMIWPRRCYRRWTAW